MHHDQNHNHTFSCDKKKKYVTIKENEGHGRNDGKIKGCEIRNIPVCRFHFPKYPMDETKVLLQTIQDLDEEEIKNRKGDLKKIWCFLFRQTYKENYEEQPNRLKRLNSMTFWEFLYEVGMFLDDRKDITDFTQSEKENAKKQILECNCYLNERQCMCNFET